MSETKKRPRFVVSNLGFAFAVHDTGEGQQYAFEAGREKPHASKNVLNTRRVALFPNRVQAQAFADARNAEAERDGRSSAAS